VASVQTGKIMVTAAVLLAVSISYWLALPAAAGEVVPLQAILGAFSYLTEIALMLLVVMTIIDGYWRSLVIASSIGLIIGVTPGTALLPTALFLPLWLKAIVPPFVLGGLIRLGWPAGRAFLLASLLMAAFVLVNYLQGEKALMTQVDEMHKAMERMVTAPSTSAGYNSDIVNTTVDKLTAAMKIFKRLLPGMVIMTGIGQLFIAFLTTIWYYTRRDSYFPGFGPFIYWKMPEKVLYGLGAFLVIRLIAEGTLKIAADNAIFILLTIYAVCGLALIEHLLRRMRLPMLVRAIFYVGLLLMQVPGLVITSGAGLFDSYFDFRKVRAHTLG
jgi:uncharacterized protein YybS (DUF2232 family)